jgi:hypothetical protein
MTATTTRDVATDGRRGSRSSRYRRTRLVLALPLSPFGSTAPTPYWHADVPGRELARGRFTLVDARPGELAAVRWFAATRARAGLMLYGDTLGRLRPTLMALGPWADAHDTVPPTAIAELRPLKNLQRVDVGMGRLLLPAGYTEAPWPGYE